MIKNIIFDFDGVILDSVPVKTEAFRELLKGFPNDKVELLIQYHLENGGVSRYKKIQYFFEEILDQTILEEDILYYAKRYSELTKEELVKSKYLISDTLTFIQKNFKIYNIHIASGADEQDLKYICEKQSLKKYFKSINGSPVVKSDIVRNILKKNHYKKEETILIGDSINDYEAAHINEVVFYGYNNPSLRNKFLCFEKYEDIIWS